MKNNLIEFVNYKNYCKCFGLTPCNSNSLENYNNFIKNNLKRS